MTLSIRSPRSTHSLPIPQKPFSSKKDLDEGVEAAANRALAGIKRKANPSEEKKVVSEEKVTLFDKPPSPKPPFAKRLKESTSSTAGPFKESPDLRAHGGAGSPEAPATPDLPKLVDERARSPFSELSYRYFIEEFQKVLIPEFQIQDPSRYPSALSRIARFLIVKLEAGATEIFLKKGMKEALSEMIGRKYSEGPLRETALKQAEKFITDLLALTSAFGDGLKISEGIRQIIQKAHSLSLMHDALLAHEAEEELNKHAHALRLLVIHALKSGVNADLLQTHMDTLFKRFSIRAVGEDRALSFHPINAIYTHTLIRNAKACI